MNFWAVLCKLIEYTKAVTYTVENVGSDAKIHATVVTHLGLNLPSFVSVQDFLCNNLFESIQSIIQVHSQLSQ